METSPMDLASRMKWVEYSKARDDMFNHTDIRQAPWYVVNADVKTPARLLPEVVAPRRQVEQAVVPRLPDMDRPAGPRVAPGLRAIRARTGFCST